MEELGSVITAIVTPFDDQLAVDEDAFVALMAHLAANGTDGRSMNPVSQRTTTGTG